MKSIVRYAKMLCKSEDSGMLEDTRLAIAAGLAAAQTSPPDGR